MTEDEKGKRGVEIAKRWWPELKETGKFSREDCSGIDAWLHGQSVQIKYDGRAIETGNVVHEVYEKDPGKPDQLWRGVGLRAKWYIWANEEWVFMVSTDSLAEMEVGRNLKRINNGGTSLGFIIPVREFADGEIHYHGSGGVSEAGQ